MFEMTLSELAAAAGGRILRGDRDLKVNGLVSDSRAVAEGNLYVPLIGERFDGHTFIESAFKSGAVACFSSRESVPDGGAVILVEDTLRAYQEVARAWRSRFNIPVVGVTGSCGKTTSKDMFYAVLSRKYNTLRSTGNHNNHIGVPMTLLGLSSEHEAAVVEMGMNHSGELRRLCELSQPTSAVITNVGLSHIEYLGSRDGILAAKLEITEHLPESALLLVNGDNDKLALVPSILKRPVTTFGLSEGCDYRAVDIVKTMEGSTFKVQHNGESFAAAVQVPGTHNILNALAAIALGEFYGVERSSILDALKEFTTPPMRQSIEHLPGGLTLIDDTYNASPDSADAGFDTLSIIKQGRAVAVLSDMLELGAVSEEAHRSVGSKLAQSGAELLLACGKESRFTYEEAVSCGMSAEWYESCEQLLAVLKDKVQSGDSVLVKGSRGMHMERVSAALRELFA